MSERIVSVPGVLGGKPCIRGTRISVAHILELLATGALADDVAAAYPQLEREDIIAALEYAASQIDRDEAL